MRAMKAVRDIVNLFGGGSALGRDIGCLPSQISCWISENAIPRARWLDLIELAERRGLTDQIGWDMLRSMHPPALAPAVAQIGAAA